MYAFPETKKLVLISDKMVHALCYTHLLLSSLNEKNKETMTAENNGNTIRKCSFLNKW